MKVNAIKSICKNRGLILLLDGQDGSQWIGIPGAMYAVDPGLVLDEQNVHGLFDFTKRESRNIKVIHQKAKDERYVHTPMDGEAEPCKQYPMSISIMGGNYLPLYTPEGMILLETVYGKPVERKNTSLEFYIRELPDEPLLLAVYRDMAEVIALIKPVEQSTADYLLQLAKSVIGQAKARDTGEKEPDIPGEPENMTIDDLMQEVSAIFMQGAKKKDGADADDEKADGGREDDEDAGEDDVDEA